MFLSMSIILFFVIEARAQISGLIGENTEDAAGVTSLMSAAINNDAPAIKFFATSRPESVNQKNVGGATALHITARNGNVETSQILLDGGADVNSSDNEGWTPLMRSVLAKNPELVKVFLVRGADASKVNSVGETAIVQASSSECSECLQQLFSGYDFANKTSQQFLDNQLKLATDAAYNKDNAAIQSILKQYKDSVFTTAVAKNEATPVVVANNTENKIIEPIKGEEMIAANEVFVEDAEELLADDGNQIEGEEAISLYNLPDEGKKDTKTTLLASAASYKLMGAKELKPAKNYILVQDIQPQITSKQKIVDKKSTDIKKTEKAADPTSDAMSKKRFTLIMPRLRNEKIPTHTALTIVTYINSPEYRKLVKDKTHLISVVNQASNVSGKKYIFIPQK
ncbi:MAG: ankyrin [Rickettsiaceae bacterium]|nr:ankyrin [Rickettsiaceae bacterium]